MLLDLIRARIHEHGPMTVAAFMDLALYHPELGYYARAPRSVAAGDFVTSVDLGPLFGELVATQLAEMAALLGPAGAPFTLVEAGAGDGRLSHAMLRGLKKVAPHVCAHTHLHLVERSAAARAAQHHVLAAWTEQAMGSEQLPGEFEGVIVANELLDALPVHRAVMREDGLREVYVDLEGDCLVEREGAPSTAALAAQLSSTGVALDLGAHAEVSTAAAAWVRDAAARLRRGFMILIDYGHEARALYGGARPMGTLTTGRNRQHADGDAVASWLDRPGEQDITAPVDFTTVRLAAAAAGCTVLGLMDQSCFLTALAEPKVQSFDDAERRSFATLVAPGGLGSTRKVFVLAKGMGSPVLRGCSGVMQLT
ncbi:MAG TPA: SAM-dependent methyltransferase [Vicinamibacterales bacterium]|nr:SAM-dependent methyltransferase [Vicinamibacterales bacterium]